MLGSWLTSDGSTARELLQQARDGDQGALGRLLEGFRPLLDDLARRQLSRGLTRKVGRSDLVQETCLEATRDFRTAQIDSVTAMKAWLRRLLINNLKDMRRKFGEQKRDHRRERPLGDQESRMELVRATLSRESPASRAARKETLETIEKALAELERGYRLVIVWRNFEALSFREIGKRLDRTEDAARMLWQRAVRRLRESLRGKI